MFDNERIPLTTHTRTAHHEHKERSDAWFAAMRTAAMYLPVGSKHTEEQREELRLLADLENRLQESADTCRALMQRLAVDTSDQASSQPAASA